jgi:glycosyltransferase involved in cell wall biosynthesis
MNSLVSIIIPVYNAEPYITDALMSVLNQDYRPIEIICCDDGSTDASYDRLLTIAQQYPELQVVKHENNQGIAATRNTALSRASGDYIAFMDADDVWINGKLRTQIEWLTNHPEHDMVYTHMECFISPELPDAIKEQRYCPIGSTPGYIPGTAVIRASSFTSVGLFNPVWRVGEFVDWLARAKDAGLESHLIETTFYRRRIHATNTGVTERPSRADYLKIIKQSLDRRKDTSL